MMLFNPALKAKYCYDDELVANWSYDDEIRGKIAKCLKCKGDTKHKSQLCAECRTRKCIKCGKNVRQTYARERCTRCHLRHLETLNKRGTDSSYDF
jgi:hypothetical protein